MQHKEPENSLGKAASCKRISKYKESKRKCLCFETEIRSQWLLSIANQKIIGLEKSLMVIVERRIGRSFLDSKWCEEMVLI